MRGTLAGLNGALILAALAAPGVSAAADAPAATGTVVGRVRYEADAKAPWRYQRFYVQNKSQGFLAEAVIALEVKQPIATPVTPAFEGGEKSGSAPSEGEGRGGREPATHVIDQKDFRFVPETIAIRRGDRVTFTNSDDVVHNVLSFDLEPFNVNTPPDGPHTQTFSKAGGTTRPVRIGCVYHSTMRAWIYVFDHPQFAVTAADGKFRLDNVPAGRYELVAVHPAGALKRTIEIEVRAGEKAEIDVTLSPAHLTTRRKQP